MAEPQQSSAQPMGRPVRQRSWVILACIPNEVASRELAPGTDVSLVFFNPPSTTMLNVANRITPDPRSTRSFPYVVDVHSSGRFLLHTTHGGLFKSVYYICDAHTGVATRLPASTVARISPRRSIGFIEDPARHGHYMVAQLHPPSSKHHETIVYYYTGASDWAVKELGSSPYHEWWGSHGGVIAHDGKLWWADLAYGLLTCDPFVDRPDLTLVALPEGRVMANANDPASRRDLDKHRCVKVSEGKLRYVEIYGASGMEKVSMWTLIDPEGPDGAVWEHEYEVLFEQIWSDESYLAAGLPPNKLPALALIHPKDHGVLYFFHGSRLFAMNMYQTEKRVLECGNNMMDFAMLEQFSNARFVHAWELPPTLFVLNPSTDKPEIKALTEEELSLTSADGDLSSFVLSQVLRASAEGNFTSENLERSMGNVQVSAEGPEASSSRPIS